MLLQPKPMLSWPTLLMRMRPPLLAVGLLAALPVVIPNWNYQSSSSNWSLNSNWNLVYSQAEHSPSCIHQLDHRRSSRRSCKHIAQLSRGYPVVCPYWRGGAGDQHGGCEALWASGLLAQRSYVIKSYYSEDCRIFLPS